MPAAALSTASRGFAGRLWRTVKYEEVYLKACDSVSGARASIRRYLAVSNRLRPRSSLDGRTPDEADFGGGRMRPPFTIFSQARPGYTRPPPRQNRAPLRAELEQYSDLRRERAPDHKPPRPFCLALRHLGPQPMSPARRHDLDPREHRLHGHIP